MQPTKRKLYLSLKLKDDRKERKEAEKDETEKRQKGRRVGKAQQPDALARQQTVGGGRLQY